MSNQSLINAADAVLTALGEVLETAYHSAKIGPDGEAVWSDADQYIMSALSPHHGPLVAALSEATKSDNWQPIETAPFDAVLLAYDEGYDVPIVMAVRVLDDDTGGEKWITADDYQDVFEPTHWQPLPPPPSEAQHD